MGYRLSLLPARSLKPVQLREQSFPNLKNIYKNNNSIRVDDDESQIETIESTGNRKLIKSWFSYSHCCLDLN